MAILTISREAGSEGSQIAAAIAEELGYDLLDKGKIIAKLKADGVRWEEMAEDWDEHVPSFLEKHDWQYNGFVALTRSHILNCALGGKAVIMGRGGNFLLEGVPNVLRVRIMVPLEIRLECAANDQTFSVLSGLDAETGRKLLKQADAKSSNYIRSAFGKDWNDPLLYDIVFNMQYLSNAEIMDAIKLLLAQKDKTAMKDSKCKDLLARRALAAKINAAIATNPSFMIPTLEVLNVGETIVVKGVVMNEKQHVSIEEEARKVAGSEPIKFELRHRHHSH
ncbi:MAG: Cytidylate kinase [Smithella sp. PtaU1.Bin162]|nr:MAG: Cytidylate kinase [Smithella sp. PtaU1.Bin162]